MAYDGGHLPAWRLRVPDGVQSRGTIVVHGGFDSYAEELYPLARCLPERGRIGVFNRSYYEEVLVVRVHPELLGFQRLPTVDPESIWAERLESIREHERHQVGRRQGRA